MLSIQMRKKMLKKIKKINKVTAIQNLPHKEEITAYGRRSFSN